MVTNNKRSAKVNTGEQSPAVKKGFDDVDHGSFETNQQSKEGVGKECDINYRFIISFDTSFPVEEALKFELGAAEKRPDTKIDKVDEFRHREIIQLKYG